MRPLIGISTERSVDPEGLRPFKRGYTLELQNSLYPDWVRAAGGCPILLPHSGDADEARRFVQAIDGLLLSGGSDLDPRRWGEEPLEPGGDVVELGDNEVVRSAFEDELLGAALDAELPVFGICRGLQQINVGLGGSLWQDLGRQLGVRGHYETDTPRRRVHEARLCARPAELPAELPERFPVTSTHHQGIRELGAGLVVFARAAEDERVVEGLLRPGGSFLLGVQWHPERILDDASTRLLAGAFMDAVRARQRDRR